MTTCPECGAPLTLPTDVVENEIIACEACSAELEIVGLEPLSLALAPQIEEDWGE